MKATRVPGDRIPSGSYQCRRCGRINTFNCSRDKKPVHCTDCRSVMALMARTAVAA